jgi:hypothetical protein
LAGFLGGSFFSVVGGMLAGAVGGG